MKPFPPRRHGFRISIGDALVLLLGLGLTLWLRDIHFPLWWVVLAAVGHFFLFCNVFLVWRRWEIIWALLFCLNVGLHLNQGDLGWVSPVLLQTPVTLLVIWLQIRSSWYHGIWADRLNPRLTDYLNHTL